MKSINQRIRALFLSGLFFMFWCGGPLLLAAQDQNNSEPYSVPRPSHPVTQRQLEILFERFGSAEAQVAFVHDALEKQRAKLPAWFPQSVWSEVIRRVEGINQISVALPEYQKYLSEEDADALLVYYDGETGKQLARNWTAHARHAMDQGFRGGTAALHTEESMGNDDQAAALARKRFEELDPQQRARCLKALETFNQFIARLNNEKNVVYMEKVKEIGRKVFTEHQSEIAAAQRKATGNSSAR
jgi:hypothetical protein